MAKKNETFESLIKNINEIIEKLENNEIELDKAVELYDECVEKIKQAEKILNTTEGKIKKIVEKLNTFETEDFVINND